ncbi:MAG TPA: replication-relaxation family protein [Jatrophihabitans sp.]|nr:replication-relaxation family protein [Jatrophihabitans sp.]
MRMHQFLTTTQLQRFHFTDHHTPAAARICRRVLGRLHQLRVIEHLDRHIGGIRAGSASYVWRIGLIGDRLLQLHDGPSARSRRKEPSPRYLFHRLAVADVHLALRDGDWRLDTVAAEPGCWRPFTGPNGARQILKPDLYAVTISGDYEDHWFIEVDRATESLPTLLKKCAQYQHYRASNQEQQRHGVFPRVLWIVPTERYAEALRRAIARTAHLPTELFRVCTVPSLPAALQEPSA